MTLILQGSSQGSGEQMSEPAFPFKPDAEQPRNVRLIRSSLKRSLCVIAGALAGLWAAVFAVLAAVIA